ncbi:MAG: hypothetical protein ABDK92_04045 [Atribacterota bacterium]
MIRDAMYRELLHQKGYDAQTIGTKTEQYLRSQIDQFWTDTLEFRFQQEILIQNKDVIATALWQDAAEDLVRLRQEALLRMIMPAPTSTTSRSTPAVSSVKDKVEASEEILNAFLSLYPDYLKWFYRTTPFSRVELIVNAEATKEGKYRLAYRLWQTIQDGLRKGEEFVAVSFEAIRTTEELQVSLESMKESLQKQEGY